MTDDGVIGFIGPDGTAYAAGERISEPGPPKAEHIAAAFHDHYERLAPIRLS